jgi:hypothetical protein
VGLHNFGFVFARFRGIYTNRAWRNHRHVYRPPYLQRRQKGRLAFQNGYPQHVPSPRPGRIKKGFDWGGPAALFYLLSELKKEITKSAGAPLMDGQAARKPPYFYTGRQENPKAQ